jgi:REP element-mobilizing transposase RayT
MAFGGLRRPSRLPGVSYVGIQRYYLTLCTFERRTWFLETATVEEARSQLLQSAADHHFAILVYCFMPDHAHILAEGTSVDSDLQRFVSNFKQKTGFQFSKTKRRRLWQDGYYDRILRTDQSTLEVVRYTLENPVRAGLVKRFDEYAHSGSDRYSLEELAEGCPQG